MTGPTALPAAAEWLIRDTRRNPDGQLLWWGPNRCGYTTSLEDAGRYTEEQARKQEACRDTDVAVPLAKALAAAVRCVPAGRWAP